ncbi:MAG: electron transport complex subunit RsxC [Treponema sp.]|nr:electron transport complex subunit RsxC [Treponema sp.]
MKKLGGILAPHLKNTDKFVPVTLPVPAEVKIPMSMHSGTPANPVVKTGDYVKVGQLIGEAVGTVSSPVHASVSGTVKSIDTLDSLTGEKAVTVTITSDGSQTMWEGLSPPTVTNLQEFLEAVRNSGVVGLGGAGYPTAPKFTLKDYSKLDYILINGAECEPYITSDTRTMVDNSDDVWQGVLLMKEYLKPKNIIICIENNKGEPIKKMKELCANTEGVSVRVLPSTYPQGERKVLVYNVTGRIVPEGGRLPDVGCIVVNCTTVATFAKYIKTGHPLVSKCITVDGTAVKKPKNVIVPLGTSVRDLLNFCGDLLNDGKLINDAKKVILGGPMMGTAVPSLDVPIVKINNALIVLSAKDAKPQEPSACLKCSRCITKCPMKLMPPNIENAYELKRPDLLQKFKVNMCAECACCAFTCPAKRPLVQVMLLSKDILWKYEQELKAKKTEAK